VGTAWTVGVVTAGWVLGMTSSVELSSTMAVTVA
jgi:hypothetical protein